MWRDVESTSTPEMGVNTWGDPAPAKSCFESTLTGKNRRQKRDRTQDCCLSAIALQGPTSSPSLSSEAFDPSRPGTKKIAHPSSFITNPSRPAVGIEKSEAATDSSDATWSSRNRRRDRPTLTGHSGTLKAVTISSIPGTTTR